MKQFLFPTSRQYPFDETCERIVRALRARNWKVPGFEVTFREYGTGAQKLRHVEIISSKEYDVEIHFGRPQDTLPGGTWNDVAAVSHVMLHKRELHVHSDESGPTLHVYVGPDWERDRSSNWTRYNARLDKLPRLCVRYSGRGSYGQARAPQLAAVGHLDDHPRGFDCDNRDYGPEGNEPLTFKTAAVMEEFRAYLQDVVYRTIDQHPITDVIDDGCADLPPIPFPKALEPLFAYVTPRDIRRIETGQKDPSALAPADRYGLLGTGRRLAATYIKNGADLPEVAYDGFLWCGPVPQQIPREGRDGWGKDPLVKLTLKDARGVYVADNAAHDKLRAALAKEIKGKRDCFTDAEVNAFERARACTIVSILDYKGDFEDPVYLINREVGLDEIESPKPWWTRGEVAGGSEKTA